MKKILFWFRNDLRLEDNAALAQACSRGQVLPVYVINPADFKANRFGVPKIGFARAQILFSALSELKQRLELSQINLLIKVGSSPEVLYEVCKVFDIDELITGKEISIDGIEEEATLSHKLKPANIDFKLVWDKTLIHPRKSPLQIRYFPEDLSGFKKKIIKNLEIGEGIVGVAPTVWIDSEFYDLRPSDLGLETASDSEQLKMGEIVINDIIEAALKTQKVNEYVLAQIKAALSIGCISPRQAYKYFNSDSLLDQKILSLLIERDFSYFIGLKYGDRLVKGGGIQMSFKDTGVKNEQRYKKFIEAELAHPALDHSINILKRKGYLSIEEKNKLMDYFLEDLKLYWVWGARFFAACQIDFEFHPHWLEWNNRVKVGVSESVITC